MEQANSSANQTEDVMKEFLVYNADLRLKSRQIVRKPRKQRKFPVKKQTLYYFGTIIVFLILIYIFLLWFAGYDAERYASVFSATIQGVSTIFALVAAGTLLLVERVGVRSPRSLSFLPTLWVTGLFSVFILVIALDIVVMLVLPIGSSWCWLIKFILVLNVASISLSAVYVRSLLVWFRPDTIFRILKDKAAKVESKEEAFEIANAVRELATKATLNHDVLSARRAINTFEDLGLMFCSKWKAENPGYDPNHPVRIVADYTQEIGLEAIAVGMDILGIACVEAICSMALYHDDYQVKIDVWIYGNIGSIAKALMKKKKGEDCLIELIMEAKVAVDQDRLSLAHWLICIFPELAEAARIHKDFESARMLAIGMEILAEAFSKKAIPVYTMDSFLQTIKNMDKFAKNRSFGLYRGYFGERGWSGERTISDILREVKVLLQTASKNVFKPSEGNWPTPRRSAQSR